MQGEIWDLGYGVRYCPTIAICYIYFISCYLDEVIGAVPYVKLELDHRSNCDRQPRMLVVTEHRGSGVYGVGGTRFPCQCV